LKTRHLAILLVLAALIAACQVLIGLDAPQLAPAVEDPCVHRSIPSPPKGSDASTANLSLGFAALRKFEFFRPIGEDPIGFDLDNQCTCDTRKGARNAPSCVSSNPVCDEPDGVDNALDRFATSLRKIIPTEINKVIGITQSIDDGTFSVMFYLAGYNGEANDPDVSLSLLNADGFVGPTSGSHLDAGPPDDEFCRKLQDSGRACTADGGLADAERPSKPCWNGCDSWASSDPAIVQDEAIRGGLVPVNMPLASGYVKDGKLVVKFDGPRSVRLGRVTLDLNEARIVADIKLFMQDGTSVGFGAAQAPFRFGLEGVITGYTGPNSLLSNLGEISVGTGQSICDLRGQFTSAKATLCGLRDVNLAGLAGGPCNGLSVAFPFSASPATFQRRASDAGALQRQCPARLAESGVDSDTYFSCGEAGPP
jgi:hypothetical protein